MKQKVNHSDSLKILLILSMPYVAVQLINSGFPALLPYVREEFVLTRTQVGYYSTFFFLSAAMLAVFTGSVVDRLGPKKGLLLGVGFLGFMSLLYSFSPSYTVLLLFALFAGLGFSIITPSVNKGVIIETPPERRAVSMGIMQSGSGIGGLVGASLLPLIGELFGWRITILATGLFVLFIGLLTYKLYKEKSKSSDLESSGNNNSEESFSLKRNLSYFLTKKQFIFMCLIGTVLAGSSVGVIFSHLAVYISEDLHMSRAAAGLGLGIFNIGGMVGRPIWGWLSDYILKGDRRSTLLLLGLTSGIMFMLPGLMGGNPNTGFALVYIFSFFLGFAAFGWPGVFFVTIGEYAGEERTGAATGIALLFGRVGILTAPPIFGLIADTWESYSYSWLIFGAVIILVSFLYYISTKKF